MLWLVSQCIFLTKVITVANGFSEVEGFEYRYTVCQNYVKMSTINLLRVALACLTLHLIFATISFACRCSVGF